MTGSWRGSRHENHLPGHLFLGGEAAEAPSVKPHIVTLVTGPPSSVKGPLTKCQALC